MLQVARLSPRLLGESSDLVLSFLRGQQNADGGFMDRGGDSDLYYTVFGLEGLLALRADLPVSTVATYLSSFGGGRITRPGPRRLPRTLLGGAAAGDAATRPARTNPPTRRHLPQPRRRYHARQGSEHGTLYGCFLGLGAYQDLGQPVPDPQALIRCVARLRTADGGYANDDDLPIGLTPRPPPPQL